MEPASAREYGREHLYYWNEYKYLGRLERRAGHCSGRLVIGSESATQKTTPTLDGDAGGFGATAARELIRLADSSYGGGKASPPVTAITPAGSVTAIVLAIRCPTRRRTRCSTRRSTSSS